MLKSILKEIKSYIETSNQFQIDENRQLFVKLDSFNDSSIDLLIYCFTKTNVWNDYLTIKEELAFNIKKIVEQNNANFAFPSQSIYIEKN